MRPANRTGMEKTYPNGSDRHPFEVNRHVLGKRGVHVHFRHARTVERIADVRTLKSVVRDLVQFHRHDVTRDPPLRPSYDLIICRNVLIYFDRENQTRILDQFINALRPHGYLILGKAETLPVPTRARLDLENARERIYKRR